MIKFSDKQVFYIGEVTYRPGGTLGPRQQRNLQIVIVYEGEANIRVNGRGRRVCSGDAVLLLPGFRESFIFSEDTPTRHGWFEAIQPVLSPAQLDAMARLPQVFPWLDRLESLLRLSLDLGSSPTGWRAESLNLMARALFNEVLGGLGYAEPGKSRFPAAVERALVFIERHLETPLDRHALARGAGQSYPHLARSFRHCMNETPIQALWRMRTQRAADLLRSTGLDLEEIAGRSGFRNVFHLSRKVSKGCGESPREIRRNGSTKGEFAHRIG